MLPGAASSLESIAGTKKPVVKNLAALELVSEAVSPIKVPDILWAAGISKSDIPVLSGIGFRKTAEGSGFWAALEKMVKGQQSRIYFSHGLS